MIASHLAAGLSANRDRIAVQGARDAWTYGELFAAARLLHDRCAPHQGKIVGVAASDLPGRLTALIALELAGAIPCLLPRGMKSNALAEWSEKLPLADVIEIEMTAKSPGSGIAGDTEFPQSAAQGEEEQVEPANSVWLFTSGTTGSPQPVEHRWSTLTSTVQYGPRYLNRRWLLAYDSASFAGMQVWLQALLTSGTISDVSQAGPAEAARRILAEQVEFASGTPTFWRMLLGAMPSGSLPCAALQQITMGGEAVSQGTLDALHAAFPQSRLTHIYATSELGVCFRVTDGQAGFPASFLQQSPEGCQLMIADDGELLVQSARRALGKLEVTSRAAAESAEAESDWQRTGDLVQQRGERIYFMGRSSGAILVGGGKVLPEEVETVIRAVPGVIEVVVSAQTSSLLGSLVRADVQVQPQAERDLLRTAILAHCQAELPKHKLPAMIEFHSELPRTASGKLARAATAE